MRTFLSVFIMGALVVAIGCEGDGTGTTKNGNSGGNGGQGGDGGQGGLSGSFTLDSAYGVDGIARASRVYSTDQIYAAAWMPDGGLLLGGSTSEPHAWHPNMLLARLTAAGQADTSFGEGGFVKMPFADGATVTSIEPLADGSALVAGTGYRFTDAYAFVFRLDAKGLWDPSFGTKGMARVELDYSERFAKMARSESGSIVLLAPPDHSNGQIWLWRFTANGQVDTAFGDAGKIIVSGDNARDLVVEPDGHMLALTGPSSSSGEGILHRFDINGVADPTFGTNGTVKIPFDSFDIERHTSGELLISGGDSIGQLMKLDAMGVPVATFGTDGILNPMADDPITAVKWLPNGDILALMSIVGEFPWMFYRSVKRIAADGTVLPWGDVLSLPVNQQLGGSVADILLKGDKMYFAGTRKGSTPKALEVKVVALSDDGSLDMSYGTAGLAQTGSGAPPEVLWDLARRTDGSFIGMGACGTDGNFVRFSGGKQDLAFGVDGFAPIKTLLGNSITVDAENRILVATLGYNVARYTATGEYDLTFGNQGIAKLLDGNGLVADVEMDGQKRIVAVGEVVNQGALVARLLDNGTLDPSFGTAGVSIGAAGLSPNAGATSLALQSDGKLVLAGLHVDQATAKFSTFVARLLENGTADTSFGMGGKTLIDRRMRPFRLLQRQSGGYLLAGSDGTCSLSGSTCPTLVVGLNADGKLDDGFGQGGVASIDDASYFNAWVGLAELPDGSIAVGGAIQEEVTEKFAVWKLGKDGSPDPAGPLVLPVAGRATSAIVDGNGLMLGGWAFDAKTGTDMVTVRLSY